MVAQAQDRMGLRASDRDLIAKTRAFTREDRGRSWRAVASTLALLAAAIAGALAPIAWPLRAAATLLAGLLVSRGFVLFHDVQHGAIGDDIVRAAALDAGRVDRQRRSLAALEPQGEVGSGDDRVASVLGVAAGVGGAAADDEREIPASGPGPGERPVGQRGGLVGQCGALAAGGPRDQRRRSRRADLLVAVEDDLVTETGNAARLDRLQRREHHRDAALHVGDSGPAEHSVLAPARRLKRMVGAEHRVHVAGQQQLHRRFRADLQVDVPPMLDLDGLALRIDRVHRGRVDQRQLAGQGGKSIGEQPGHRR
jgi:hypothetical protein